MGDCMSLRIILASSSPRRRLLLRQIGLSFEVMPACFDEIVEPKSDPADIVESFALQKAEQIAHKQPESLVIGSDTVVVCRGKILGKPSDPAEAQAMLRSLSGITHQVYTGVALVRTGPAQSGTDQDGSAQSGTNQDGPAQSGSYTTASFHHIITRHSFHERTDVTFGELNDEEIAAYVRSGSPLDKAGSYGIQDDLGALFVEKINGDYYNVVGFPLFRFYREVNKHMPGAVTPFEFESTSKRHL